MTTSTLSPRLAYTGHPLGFVDVFSKLIETTIGSTTDLISSRIAARRQAAFDQATARAAEARTVRMMADHQRKVSPSFAADLDAAADRHEGKRQN